MEKTFVRTLPYLNNPDLVACSKVELRLDRHDTIQIHLARIRIGYRRNLPKCNCDFTGLCPLESAMIELRSTR